MATVTSAMSPSVRTPATLPLSWLRALSCMPRSKGSLSGAVKPPRGAWSLGVVLERRRLRGGGRGCLLPPLDHFPARLLGVVRDRVVALLRLLGVLDAGRAARLLALDAADPA